MVIKSSRSMPATLTPSAVMATLDSPMFWKKAAPGGRYHISLFAQSAASGNTASPSDVSMPTAPAGVDGWRTEAVPKG